MCRPVLLCWVQGPWVKMSELKMRTEVDVCREKREKIKKKRSEDEELQEFTPCLVKGLNVFVFKLALASLGSS